MGYYERQYTFFSCCFKVSLLLTVLLYCLLGKTFLSWNCLGLVGASLFLVGNAGHYTLLLALLHGILPARLWDWGNDSILSTHASTRDSWKLTGKSESVSYGDTAPFSWLLVHKRLCLCPPRVCFPNPVEVCNQIQLASNSNSLRVLSLFARSPVGKSVVCPKTFLTVWEFLWYNCFAVCGLSAQWLYDGANGDLLQDGLCHMLRGQVCCSQSPCSCIKPLLTLASTGDTQTIKGRSGSVSVGPLGPGAYSILVGPSKSLWWVCGLILNVISPLLPFFGGFAFALGCGVSFFGGIQHSPVNGYSPVRWNFGVLVEEDDHTSFYSAILYWANQTDLMDHSLV